MGDYSFGSSNQFNFGNTNNQSGFNFDSGAFNFSTNQSNNNTNNNSNNNNNNNNNNSSTNWFNTSNNNNSNSNTNNTGFNFNWDTNTNNNQSSNNNNFNFNTGTGAVPFVKPNTKFTDLPEGYKKKYLDLEAYIQAQRKTRDEIADDIKKPIPRENISVDSLNERLAALSRDIQKESKGLQSYIDKVRNELKYGEQAARNLTKAKAQRPFEASPFNTTVPLPSQYHWEKLSAFSDSLDRITRQIDEIDQYLIAAEQTHASSRVAHNPKALQHILTTQHTALCALTARVAHLHSLCDELRDKYRSLKMEEMQTLGRTGGAAGLNSNGSYSYPSVFGGGGSSLYDKVAGGGGSDLLMRSSGAGGAIVFEGENDDAIDEKRNRSADPFAELSYLNTQTTSLVPQPQTTTGQQQQQQQQQSNNTTNNSNSTGFDWNFGSTSNSNTNNNSQNSSLPTFNFGNSSTTGQNTSGNNNSNNNNNNSSLPTFNFGTNTNTNSNSNTGGGGGGGAFDFNFGGNNAFSFGNTNNTNNNTSNTGNNQFTFGVN